MLRIAPVLALTCLPLLPAQQVVGVTKKPPKLTNERIDAVARGLDWLRRNNNANQSMMSRSAEALAFMANGSTMRAGQDKGRIKDCIRFLRNRQIKDGLHDPELPGPYKFETENAMCGLAVAEAMAVSRYKLLYKPSRTNVAAAGEILAQRDEGTPRSLFFTALCAQMMLAASHNVEVDRKELSSLRDWVLERRNAKTGRFHDVADLKHPGRHDLDHLRHHPLEQGELATAAGLTALFFLDEDRRIDKEIVQASAEVLRRRSPIWNSEIGAIDEFYWLMATDALHQIGGDAWEDWNGKIEKVLLENQVKEGPEAGSWDPVGVWGSREGRAFSTAMMVTILWTPVRHSRFIKID